MHLLLSEAGLLYSETAISTSEPEFLGLGFILVSKQAIKNIYLTVPIIWFYKNAQISPGKLKWYSNATFWSDTGAKYRKLCTKTETGAMESPKAQREPSVYGSVTDTTRQSQ